MSNSKRPRAVVKSLPGEEVITPEAETKVPCPVCLKGMVSAPVRQRIEEILKGEADGPELAASIRPPRNDELPQVNTDLMPVLPEQKKP